MKTKRPPIVTVLGHVDHGKTTLLDAIRKTNVQNKEVGGITQSIGASQLLTKGGKITFVDTPGHAAFSAMRKQGAKLSDIALLIVAADDGVKPQTKEALEYIRAAQIPFVVVLTKVDLPSADTQKALGELEKEGVLFEKRGGDTPWLEVSAKNKQGLPELIELIELIAEVNEISGSKDEPLDGLIIETNKDKRGVLVSAVIRNGKLTKGDSIFASGQEAKVKAMFDYLNKSINEVGPGDPVLIMGFTEVPQVGDSLSSIEMQKSVGEHLKREVPSIGKNQIGVVLKASTAGALEAIIQSLPENVVVVRSGVGEINENDVFFAKSAKASVFAFEIKPGGGVQKLADTEGVQIYDFKIIYELIEKVEEILEQGKEKILAKALIMAKFPYEKLQVAGCKIVEGEVTPKTIFKLMRGERELGEVKIKSLKRGKEDLTLARAGEECGILFVPQLDFEPSDVLLSVNKLTESN